MNSLVIVWTVGALTGFVVALFTTLEAWNTWSYAEDKLVRKVARFQTRRAVTWTIAFLIFSVIGIGVLSEVLQGRAIAYSLVAGLYFLVADLIIARVEIISVKSDEDNGEKKE